MATLIQLSRRRRRARWCDDPQRLRDSVRDEHRDCWRDDHRAA